jgi:sigma-B regulation protein RsbU (phosphoserine phosphatase)
MSQFATFFLARVDGRNLTLTFSNAGHNFPMLFRGAGQPLTLERGGTVVGILEDATFDEESIDLRPGDRLVMYTDGITEAENARGDLFGEERLIAAVHAIPAERSAREVTEGIVRAVRGFLDGKEAGDDMTVMVLRVHGDGTPPEPRPALSDRSSVPDDHSSTRA